MLLHKFRRKFHPGSKAWKATPPLTFAIGTTLGFNLYLLALCTVLIHLMNAQIWNFKRNAKITFLHCTVNCALFLTLAHNALEVYATVVAMILAVTTLTQAYIPLRTYLTGFFGIFSVIIVVLYSIRSLTNSDKVLLCLSLLLLFILSVFIIKAKMFYILSNRILYCSISLLTLLIYLHSSLSVFLALSLTFANAISGTLGEVRR